MDKFQLVRGFGRVYGLTPHAYLMQRRIHLARALLAAGEPVIRVATDAGFADQSHLTRLFTRTLGITPAAYRRAFG
jgi:AraC-like DNA-binding protein